MEARTGPEDFPAGATIEVGWDVAEQPWAGKKRPFCRQRVSAGLPAGSNLRLPTLVDQALDAIELNAGYDCAECRLDLSSGEPTRRVLMAVANFFR